MKDKRLLALVKKAMKKDPDAFTKLVEWKAKEILYLCWIEMKTKQEAEDAAQEVLIQLYKSIPRLKAAEAFNVWLNRVVFNTCSKMKRDNQKHNNVQLVETYEEIEWAREPAGDNHEQLDLKEAVMQLPEKQRRCILLHYYQGFDYKEISQITGLNKDQVNTNLRFARKRLRMELEEENKSVKEASKKKKEVKTLALSSFFVASADEMIPKQMEQNLVKEFRKTFNLNQPQGDISLKRHIYPLAMVGLIGVVVGLGINRGKGGGENNSNEMIMEQEAVSNEQSSLKEMREYAYSGSLKLDDGCVIDATARTCLEGVEVQVLGEDAEIKAQTKTDREGRFSIEGEIVGESFLKLVVPIGTKIVGNTYEIDEGGVVSAKAKDEQPWKGVEFELSIPSWVEGELQISGLLEEQRNELQQFFYEEGAIQLLDPEEKVVAQTFLREDGTYIFENPMISQNGTYYVQFCQENDARLKVQSVEIELCPGFFNKK